MADFCPQCLGIEREFNADAARRDLRDYRRHGAPRSTRLLTDELVRLGVVGSTVLDIGGGIGAIPHALLKAGAERASIVEASSAFVRAAAEEAAHRGLADRIEPRQGDFVSLAGDVPPADIVTLDRVVCCYSDAASLVAASAGKAQRLYGLVYPRREWWLKVGFAAGNVLLRLRGSMFRVFLHPPEAVEAVVERMGFWRVFHSRSGMWQVAVYAAPAV
jgi:magnesium-protoporphyrin O-methyltransferase